MVKREGRCRILDLGTGTGAIGLALASQIPESLVTATDISAEALATAAGNAAAAGVSNRFTRCIPTGFRQSAGNFMQSSQTLPIYAVKRSMACKPKYGSTIRAVALDGGPDGLDAYRHIADGATAHLEHDGQVAVEIGHTQRQEVERLFAQAGYRLISMHRDLAGSDRAMVFSR